MLRVGHDVVLVVQIDQVPAAQDYLVDRLLVEGGALGKVAHLPRLVQEGVDVRVARARRVEAPSAGVKLVDVPVRIHATAPANEEGLELAVVVILESRGELRGPERDVETGVLGHALDHLAHAPHLGIVDDGHLEAVAIRQAGIGQELLGFGDVTGGALAALVIERAHGGDRRAARRVLAVPGDLIQCLTIDAEIQRLANPGIVGERRPQIDRRRVLPVLVVEVDGDALIVEAGNAGDHEPALLLQAGGVRRPDELHHVDIPRAQVGQPHVVIGDDAEHEPIELGLARIEVVLGFDQDDPILGHPLGEGPRAHAHGLGAELLAQLVGLGGRDRHPRPVGQHRHERGERRLQAEAHRQGIHDLDGADQLQLAPPGGALHVEVPVEGVPDRLGVHGGAVVELHPLAQLDGHGLAAVGKGRQLGRELGDDLQVLIDLVKLLTHVLVDDAAHVGSGQAGVQNVRILVERNDEGCLLRLGGPRRQRQGDKQSDEEAEGLDHHSTHGRSLPESGLVPVGRRGQKESGYNQLPVTPHARGDCR